MKKHIDIDWEAIVALAFIALTFALIIGAIVAGVQNESNRITEGVIVDKQFIPKESYYSDTKDSFTYRHTPARYLLLLQGTKNGETVEYWCEVNPEDYAAYRVGDYYRK